LGSTNGRRGTGRAALSAGRQRRRPTYTPALAEGGAQASGHLLMLGGFDAFGEYVGAGLLGVGSIGGHDLGDRLVGTLLHQVQVELDHIRAQKGHQRQ